MMGWDSKPHYPPGALKTVTVKATEYQKSAWTAAAKRMGMGGPGPFVAWAADLHIALWDAYIRACERHDEQVNPGSRK
jgi:hypothetical protein